MCSLGFRSVIDKCNFIRPNCMACGSIMLKKSDFGIILKRWDNVSRKNFITAALGIHHVQCSLRPRQNPPPPPKKKKKTIYFKYATFGITLISLTVYSNPAITSMNSKARLVREKNAIPLLTKCTCPINTIYVVTFRQNRTNIWTTST